MFLIPAKVFPTRYRCACYGASAAVGSLGGISVIILTNAAGVSNPVFVLMGSSLMGALGAVLSYFRIPNV